MAYSSDMRRAHLSREERAGLDHKIQTQFRAEMANWAVQVRMAVVWNLDKLFVVPSSSTALKPVSKWGSAASPLSLREGR